MAALNFKTIVIGFASLLVVSVAHGKCYPGLDCPEDLPGGNSQPTPSQVPEPTTELQTLPEEQSTIETGRIVGRKIDDASEESVAPSKYKKYQKYQKYSGYPK